MNHLSPLQQPHSIDRLIQLIERADNNGKRVLGIYDNALVGFPLTPQEIFSYFLKLERYEFKLNSMIAENVGVEATYFSDLIQGQVPLKMDDCAYGPMHIFKLKNGEAYFQLLNYPMSELKWDISPFGLYFDKNPTLQEQLMQVPAIICMHPDDPVGLGQILIDVLRLAKHKNTFAIYHCRDNKQGRFENPTFEDFKWD